MRPAAMMFLLISLILYADLTMAMQDTDDDRRHRIIVHTTYGYLDGDNWIIPVRAWVHNPRSLTERLAVRISRSMGRYGREEHDIFRSRLRDILANSRSRRVVGFYFDKDPDEKQYRVTDDAGSFPRTDLNGIIRGVIKIPVSEAERIMDKQDSDNGWLTFHASASRYSGAGRIRLVEPEGLSVISDIDDTVKITEMPAGARIIVRNTFFKEYKAAPGMAELYGEWEDAAFHYVSGTPWKLYRPLAQFLFSDDAGFPKGSLHMKNVTKNFFSLSTWRDLRELATNEMVTYDQKILQISQIMQHFPKREFILVGDSGERDPEVYRTIESKFPDQVRKIYIRDVVNDRENDPERLEGMTIIPAPTIEFGISQFDAP